MTIKFSQKTHSKYVCKNCDFITCNKYDYNKHLMTRKHQNTIKYNENARKNAFFQNYECVCGKSYPYKASLYNHKKKLKLKKKLTEYKKKYKVNRV